MSEPINISDLRTNANAVQDEYNCRHAPPAQLVAAWPFQVLALVEAVEAARHVLVLANREGRLLAGGRGLQDALARFDFGDGP